MSNLVFVSAFAICRPLAGDGMGLRMGMGMGMAHDAAVSDDKS